MLNYYLPPTPKDWARYEELWHKDPKTWTEEEDEFVSVLYHFEEARAGLL